MCSCARVCVGGMCVCVRVCGGMCVHVYECVSVWGVCVCVCVFVFVYKCVCVWGYIADSGVGKQGGSNYGVFQVHLISP